MRTSFEAVSAKALDSNELTLTCKGMSSVNWDCSDADFEFLFGEDKVCRVHSVLAEFLSPKVARLRKCDPLCNVYTFKDSELFSVFERLVLSLRSGEALRVEKSNFAALLSLSQELENSELLSSLPGIIKVESLSLEEAILLLRVGIDLGFSGRFGNLRDYVASRFHEIEEEILDNLDIETAQILLSSPSLQIEDEDSLYDFVRSRAESDLSFTSLFELVYFEYLSVDRIENFASFVSENLLENINSGIWRQICRRLILETKPNEKNPHVSKDKQDTGKKMTKPGIEFVYDSSKQLEGIIAHLTKQCGGNVHDKGIVNATASSVNGACEPKHAADLGTTPVYQSRRDQEGAWICYEFKERRVIPTSYSVKTYSSTANPKSWVIEVSNDGTQNSWTEIDRRENNNDLKNPNVIANFKISRVPSDGFRFFRLRQIGKDHADMNYLTIRALEIFGTLFKE